MVHTRSKVRLSRALGIPLTPKASRVMEHRPHRPGQHGRGREKVSDYKLRLVEKQRLRAQYALGERQLRRAFNQAVRSREPTGEALVVNLERRLDSLVLRAGFARTIWQARQSVSHGHVRVDGSRVDKPSYRVRPGQVIDIAPGARRLVPYQAAAAGEYAPATVPDYLDVDLGALRAELIRLPQRREIPVLCQEQLVVEFYAR